MIGNPDYSKQFDFAPTQAFGRKGDRQYQDFMTGDWVWDEAVIFFLVVHFLSYTNSYLGCDCKGPRNAWSDARSDHSWKRQNYCFRCDRS